MLHYIPHGHEQYLIICFMHVHDIVCRRYHQLMHRWRNQGAPMVLHCDGVVSPRCTPPPKLWYLKYMYTYVTLVQENCCDWGGGLCMPSAGQWQPEIKSLRLSHRLCRPLTWALLTSYPAKLHWLPSLLNHNLRWVLNRNLLVALASSQVQDCDGMSSSQAQQLIINLNGAMVGLQESCTVPLS